MPRRFFFDLFFSETEWNSIKIFFLKIQFKRHDVNIFVCLEKQQIEKNQRRFKQNICSKTFEALPF